MNFTSIILSDFVKFDELKFDRVIFFERDQKQHLIIKNQVLLQVQQIVVKSTINRISSHELILIKDNVIELQFHQVSQAEKMHIQWFFETSIEDAEIKWVYNQKTKQFRFVDQFKALQDELEQEYYDCQHIINFLKFDVQSMSLTCFIDDFDLYHNMYQALSEIYLTSSTLTLIERQKTRNVYLIILSSHDADLNDVIQAFAKKFIRLESECKLLISEKEKTVWALILAYMKNMKSQQAIVNFLEFRANYSCRMCYADELTRDDMIFDTVNYDHYHHQILHTRSQDVAIIEKKKREKFFQAYELTLEFSALQAMTLALDLILSRSDNLTHSEFADIVRRVMSILCHEILTSSILKIFTECFQSFSFSSDWSCIQSSAKHLRS